ncbi:MAG: hypothetical protein Q4G49_17395, partial [Paracoccus sp. (in: a-proteobacteria)]|nr:hypothetical protein [Paracoccus sp. (in: a-proteobacteria)]
MSDPAREHKPGTTAPHCAIHRAARLRAAQGVRILHGGRNHGQKHMTYCVGLKLNDGLVLLSDTRTNAGLDNIAT